MAWKQIIIKYIWLLLDKNIFHTDTKIFPPLLSHSLVPVHTTTHPSSISSYPSVNICILHHTFCTKEENKISSDPPPSPSPSPDEIIFWFSRSMCQSLQF